MTRQRLIATAAVAALSAAFGSAHARGMDVEQQSSTEFRGALSAEQLLGMDVQGSNGESIGEIAQIVLSEDGDAKAVIFTGGGVLGLGETTYRIPWQQVQFGAGEVTVPMTASQIARFEWGAENVDPGWQEVLATAVIDSNAALRDGMRFGEIEDLILARDGELQTLVVDADLDGMGEQYAYPFRGDFAFNEYTNDYRLSYTLDQVANLDPFDYGTVGIDLDVGATADVGGVGEGSFSSY